MTPVLLQHYYTTLKHTGYSCFSTWRSRPNDETHTQTDADGRYCSLTNKQASGRLRRASKIDGYWMTPVEPLYYRL